jgi:hypothetical protein
MAGSRRRLPAGVRAPEWSREKDTLEHFERFAHSVWVPETNERFRLRPWQLDPLEDYFAGGADPEWIKHLWEWPSGQGKSGLLGLLALHHGTYCVPKPRVFVVGGLFEHARNTINAAAGFIHESRARNGLLGYWWQPQEHAGGRIVPLWLPEADVGIFARSAGRSVEAKGGSSVEGKNPTLILVEELHRHEDGGAAVNTLEAKTIKSGAVGRVVKVAIVTNAGTNRKTPLGRLIEQATDPDQGAIVETDRRPGEYHTRGANARIGLVAHIWEVPETVAYPTPDAPDEEVDGYLEHVKRANPAEWITVKTLKRVWASLDRIGRWVFLRQNANQWVTAGLAALDRGQWWRLRARDENGQRVQLKIPEGKGIRVFVGLDRAQKWDSTAIVPVWKPPKGKVRVAGAVILENPRNGKRRRTRDVGEILEAMHERWPDMVIVFDRNQGGGDVAEQLEEDHGLTIIDHGQGTEFDLASMRLGEYVEQAKLEHDGNEKLAAHVLAAVVVETSNGKRWRGEAPDDETQIDGFDALAMALHMATTVPERQPLDLDDFRMEQL